MHGAAVALVDPKDPWDLKPKQFSIRVGVALLELIDRAAKRKGYSRAELIALMLKLQMREEIAAEEEKLVGGKK